MAQFPAVIDLASLTGSTGLNPGIRLNGIDPNDYSGRFRSVASAGDVNGDGFADLIIGALNGDPAGESYLIFGKASGFAPSQSFASLDGKNGFRLNGVDSGDISGLCVASAGDVNGDGFADVIIGAPAADPGDISYAGETYVVFGRAAGFPKNFDLSTLDGSNGFRLNGIDANDNAGIAVASAGDVNGDGFADVIVGARNADASAGESYVVFGKADWSGTATLDFSSLDGTNGFRLDGINPNDLSGTSVASAGDINGDGIADLIIGAPRADPGGNSAGQTYVVFGKVDWSGTPAVGLSTLNGTNGFRLDGLSAYDYSGWSAASAGDVNGDGFADLIIGAYGGDPNAESYAGESYVVFGKADWSATPAFDLSTLNGSNGFRIDGVDPSDQSGSSVASAGDVNGDGFDDLIVGAPAADAQDGESHGEAYVVFGKASGFAATFDLATLDGSNGFRLDGIDEGDLAGNAVASAGDVNHDGFADLMIGAFRADPGGDLSAGETYIVFGRKPDAAVTRTGTGADQTLAGGDFADVLSGLAGEDVLWGHGSADTLNGGLGDDILRGGLGKDILDARGFFDFSGTNVFDFDKVAESKKGIARDVITDFIDINIGAPGSDLIDLETIDAKSHKAGNQTFHFIGTQKFHDKKGELHYRLVDNADTSNDVTLVEGDTNGDGKADFQIELTGLHTLAAGDFVL